MYLDIFDVHPLVALINLLPDIDPLYAGEKLQENGRDVPKTVQHILDEEENGRRYRRLDALPNLKRKREVDEPKKPNCAALAAKERFTSEEHRAKHKAINYLTMSYVFWRMVSRQRTSAN